MLCDNPKFQHNKALSLIHKKFNVDNPGQQHSRAPLLQAVTQEFRPFPFWIIHLYALPPGLLCKEKHEIFHGDVHGQVWIIIHNFCPHFIDWKLGIWLPPICKED